jgi:choline transport protein
MHQTQESSAKATGSETRPTSASGQGSVEIGVVESHGMSMAKSNTNADDAILRAQGHKAAMPRLFSIVSSLGLMFWYVLSGLLCLLPSQQPTKLL